MVRAFFSGAFLFNVWCTYLGTRNLIYSWHATDWSTVVQEVAALPVGVVIAVHFLWRMRRNRSKVSSVMPGMTTNKEYNDRQHNPLREQYRIEALVQRPAVVASDKEAQVVL